MNRAAMGLRVHSGWAALVAIAEGDGGPIVADRRRIDLVDPVPRGAKQPYHAAQKMRFAEAEAFVARCASTSRGLASAALFAVMQALRAGGHEPIGCALLTASGRPLPELASILASHALIHAAEGEMFREALSSAAAELGLPVSRVREKSIHEEAAKRLKLSGESLGTHLAKMGREAGRPWQADQKNAALAAWMSLAGH